MARSGPFRTNGLRPPSADSGRAGPGADAGPWGLSEEGPQARHGGSQRPSGREPHPSARGSWRPRSGCTEHSPPSTCRDEISEDHRRGGTLPPSSAVGLFPWGPWSQQSPHLREQGVGLERAEAATLPPPAQCTLLGTRSEDATLAPGGTHAVGSLAALLWLWLAF